MNIRYFRIVHLEKIFAQIFSTLKYDVSVCWRNLIQFVQEVDQTRIESQAS